jgi:hypothetical protein
MSEKDVARSEQQERLELDREPEPGGIESRAWERADPDSGSGPAAGPEQAAMYVDES